MTDNTIPLPSFSGIKWFEEFSKDMYQFRTAEICKNNSNGKIIEPGVAEQWVCPACYKLPNNVDECINTQILQSGTNFTWKVFNKYIHWRCRKCNDEAMVYYNTDTEITKYQNPQTKIIWDI